jgi:hypothetical protein
MFNLNPTCDTTGITTMGEIEVVPALIVKRFGPPAKGDGYKVSGEYVFVDVNGEPFVVHDWKSTSLWDKSFPGPEEFWAYLEPAELVISSRDVDIGEFEKWFLQQLTEV